MPARSFADDAEVATTLAQPVARGIAVRLETASDRPPTLTAARKVVRSTLPGWDVRKVRAMPGWFEVMPPDSQTGPMPLGAFWKLLREVRELNGVRQAEPLFLVANPDPSDTVGFAQDQIGLWGWPYDEETRAKIARLRDSDDAMWHLTQLRVKGAHTAWLKKHPGKQPGHGIVVAHPDTGFTDHPEMKGRWNSRGLSFLAPPGETLDAHDDLASGPIAAPGHGTATASVIASGPGESDGTWVEVHGIAPGAKILPLRVSTSVIHFDFSNVANAIAHAIEANADVISMSLGGPVRSEFLRECIREAHRHGIIVVSAAGNNLPTVVYPAAFPEVVAVAATHAAAEPWRHSGLGGTVDIAAPGEDVWRARSTLEEDGPAFTGAHGTGTSYATACVAGIAALWLSYHGGRDRIAANYNEDFSAIPIAFQYLLARTADTSRDFVRRGRHGSGIANAESLLQADLPQANELERFRAVLAVQSERALATITGLFTGWLGVTDDLMTYRPSIDLALEATALDGAISQNDVGQTDAVIRIDREVERETAFLRRFLGNKVDTLREELLVRITADRLLLVGAQHWQPGESLVPLFDRILTQKQESAGVSSQLERRLREQRDIELERERPLYRGRLDSPEAATRASSDTKVGPERPAYRRLRAYAFDPSQETMLDTVPISQVTIPVRWEPLAPGPIGEYLEVVDVDPPSRCVYPPVDLDHPHVLAQDGLTPSEANPQFHQQMIYAVAMATISRFELAMGRPVFWSSIRPWLQEEQAGERWYYTKETKGNDSSHDRYVQRLRIYPHGLRDQNAHYSPPKRALAFGYFPASDDATGKHYPGGMVFTCLSHDIIVHETTHALLDGMHPYFKESGSVDMWAFHEAFADIIALFQHFTYPEVLRHQIARTRGDLETNNLLGQLAQQFGQTATGRHALRDALGTEDDNGKWQRNRPDPLKLITMREPHDRGSILVAAVFDAFLALYNDRIADLKRISTSGTGVIPAGQIHPDLVNRLASTAAQTAGEVLNTCIRALDYVPPVDLDFGEFLRALITADHDLSPAGNRGIRIAFIEAFRSWGIYPRDITALSEESLMWRGPDLESSFLHLHDLNPQAFADREENLAGLRLLLERWQPGQSRDQLFEGILTAQASLHGLLEDIQDSIPGQPILPGLDLRPGAKFSVSNLRIARRTGTLGEYRTELIVEVVQSHWPTATDGTRQDIPLRGGTTLIVDLADWKIRYVISKRLFSRLPDSPGDDTGVLAARLVRRESERSRLDATRPRAAWSGEDADVSMLRLAQTYGAIEPDGQQAARSMRREPFRFIHHAYGAQSTESEGALS